MYYKIDFKQTLRLSSYGYEHLSKKRKHPTRTLKEYVFYIVTAGELHILHNGEDLYLHKGDAMLFHPSETQGAAGISHCEYVWCHFESDSVTLLPITDAECDELIRERHLRTREASLHSAAIYDFLYAYVKKRFHIGDMALFDYAVSLFLKNPFTPEARNPERRLQLSAMLADLFFRLEGCDTKRETHYLAHKLTKFIERTYAKNLSAKELEAAFSLGIDHLNRVLKKAIGKSIVKYRNLLRIEEATKRISDSSASFSEIAAELGFESYPYFSRLFKRETGFSPEEYRKRRNGGDPL